MTQETAKVYTIRRTLNLRPSDWERLEMLAKQNGCNWHAFVRGIAQGNFALMTPFTHSKVAASPADDEVATLIPPRRRKAVAVARMSKEGPPGGDSGSAVRPPPWQEAKLPARSEVNYLRK